MAKVVITDGPQPTPTTAECTDARGRLIKIRKVSALGRYDLVKLLSGADSEKGALMAMALAAFCVTSIDGEPMPQAADEAQLRAAIAELDDDGITAVGDCYAAAGWLPKEPDKAVVKN